MIRIHTPPHIAHLILPPHIAHLILLPPIAHLIPLPPITHHLLLPTIQLKLLPHLKVLRQQQQQVQEENVQMDGLSLLKGVSYFTIVVKKSYKFQLYHYINIKKTVCVSEVPVSPNVTNIRRWD